jgi:hypothetical protein
MLDKSQEMYHDTGLGNLVHQGNLLSHFGFWHVGLTGVNDINTLHVVLQEKIQTNREN